MSARKVLKDNSQSSDDEAEHERFRNSMNRMRRNQSMI